VIIVGFIVYVIMMSSVSLVNADNFGNDDDTFVDYEDRIWWRSFREFVDWDLQYSPDRQTWVSFRQVLDVERIFDNDLVKFNLVFEVPIPNMYWRFGFTILRDCVSVTRVNDSYFSIVYDDYECFFDISDIYDTNWINSLDIDYGRSNYKYWFRMTTNRVIGIGTYEIDPWFGNQDPSIDRWTLKDKVQGSNFSFDFNGDYAVIDNITADVSIKNLGGGNSYNVTCGVYDNVTGKLLGQTEVRLISRGHETNDWEVFNFTVPLNVTQNNSQGLKLVAWGDGIDSNNRPLIRTSSGGKNDWDDDVYDSTLPDPFVSGGFRSETCRIYASYTITNITTPVGAESNVVSIHESLFILILWVALVHFEVKISRKYIGIPFILGLTQFILPILAYITGYYDASILRIWLVVGFGFLVFGFYKLYKGLE